MCSILEIVAIGSIVRGALMLGIQLGCKGYGVWVRVRVRVRVIRVTIRISDIPEAAVST